MKVSRSPAVAPLKLQILLLTGNRCKYFLILELLAIKLVGQLLTRLPNRK